MKNYRIVIVTKGNAELQETHAFFSIALCQRNSSAAFFIRSMTGS